MLLILLAPAQLYCSFGGITICSELFDYIRSILPEKSTILELGSGFGTQELSKYYTMYSIEDSKQWIAKNCNYNTTYIFAPIKDGWYDRAAIKKYTPRHYDLILVDGPYKVNHRSNFYRYLNLFKTDIPIIFDDVHFKKVYSTMLLVAKKLKRSTKTFRCPSNIKNPHRMFGIVLP